MNLPNGLLPAGWTLPAWLPFAAFAFLAARRAPWRLLADSTRLNAFLALIVTLILLWHLQAGVKPGLALHLLGATVFTLCFGWALAFLGLCLVLAAVTLNGAAGWQAFAVNALLLAGVGVTVSQAAHWLVDRLLPSHLFVFIFCKGFFTSALAVIAVGSGNDWIRMFGIPQNCADAIRAIREEHSFLQDVGVVSYEEAKYRQSRYMVNVAGAGYEAQVVRCFNHLKKKGRRGRWLYTWSVIRSFFRYKPTGTKVWVDGKRVYNDLLLSIALGVGKYNGGGIQQLPDAVADDGMFDISLVRPIHFWHIIFRFHKLFNGKIYEIRHILRERGGTICIESSPEIEVELDGELLGHTPLEFTMLRRAIRVVVSREFLESME